MSPHKLHMMHLRRRAACLLRKGLHALEVRRARAALAHHTDQLDQLGEFARNASVARIWHARQAAIAKASLRALGDLPSPLHGAASNDSPSITVESIDCDGPAWATQRLGAVIVLTSAGIVAAGLWHLAA